MAAIFNTPKITETDGTTLQITSLNSVINETNDLVNRLISFPLPTTNTSGNRASNWLGKVRTVTIQGRHYGDGYTGATVWQKIEAFINEVEDWVNNGQQDRRIYHSIFGKQYKVFCKQFTYNWSERPGTHITFTMVLLEGGDIINDSLSDLLLG